MSSEVIPHQGVRAIRCGVCSQDCNLNLARPTRLLNQRDAAPDHHPMDVDLNASGEFMLGPDLLVAAPPFPDKVDDYEAELPSAGWYDFWTGKRLDNGRTQARAGGLEPDAAAGRALATVRIHPELATLAVFVRPGTILPIEPLVQSTDERPRGPIKLRVFPGPNCSGEVYQDDGTTFAYQRGDFLRMRFTCNTFPDTGEISIHIGRHEGNYPAWWSEIAVELDGVAQRPKSVIVNGRNAGLISGDKGFTVTVPDSGTGFEITFRQ